MSPRRLGLLFFLVSTALASLLPTRADAHCDALDGPVVADARRALTTGDLDPVLKWVPVDAEAEARDAFARARRVRVGGGEAADLADTWFFETVVRVHRAGEGAPYTGLKAAGLDLGAAIPAADRAVKTGDGTGVTDLLLDEVHHGLEHRLERVRSTAGFADVAGGREHVHAYVEFVHYVERLHEAATTSAHPAAAGHGEDH